MTRNERIRAKAGVIGVGSMGTHHARVYSELPTVDLVGVSDADDGRAREVANKHGTSALDRERLLAAADAVSIAVPTSFHFETAKRAIEAGVDVLVEKPFVADPAEGRELIDLAAAHDVTIQVGHVERFNPAVRAALEIAAGEDVIAIDAQRLGPPLDRDIQDSAVLDLMIHDIDVVLAMVDAGVASVNALGAKNNRYIDAQLQFDDGIVTSLTASRVTQEKVRELSITTEDCWITVDYIAQSVEMHRHSLPEYIEQNGDIHYRHEGIVERPMIESGEALKRELAAFVDSVVEGTPPEVTAEDGLRALEIAREIDEIAGRSTERAAREVDAR